MKFLIVTLAIAGLAFAQGVGQMRRKLKCQADGDDIHTDVSVEMGDFSMPDEPQRVTLDDLKYTLHSITPSVKQQLDSILNILGMNLNDMEQIMDNPPDEIKQMFGTSGMSIGDMTSLIGDLPAPIKQILKSVN